jgi:hypothetical protein
MLLPVMECMGLRLLDATNELKWLQLIDWECVLAVAKENALKAGIDNRYSTIPGSAFEVDYGWGYDLILDSAEEPGVNTVWVALGDISL